MNALGQEARALIDGVAKLDEPTPADKQRVRARISAELGAAVFATLAVSAASSGAIATSVAPAAGVGAGSAALHASAGGGAAQSASWSLLGKLALSGAALMTVTGALWLGGGRSEQARDVQNERAAQAPVEAPQPAVASEQTTTQAAAREQVEPREEAPVAATPAAAPAKSKRSAAPHKSVTAVEPAPAMHPSTLGAELEMLGEAQAALRAGKAERALALAAEHRASYPAGVMKEERDGIEVLAGCALGRDYRAQAEAFVQSAQSSPLKARVRKACGIEP